MSQQARKNWLADPDSKVVADHLTSMHGDRTIWGSNPISQAWTRNILAYYSAVLEPGSWDTSLVFDGKQGELVKMVVPQARSLVRQLVTLVTKQKMDFNALAESESGDVVEETRLGNSVMEQVIDRERVDQKGDQMAEFAAVTGQGFMGAFWRTDKGEPHAVDQESGGFIYKGGVEVVTPHILDVFYDYTIPEWENVPWVELRVSRNRWDLIAQFPKLADDIMRIESSRVGRGTYTWQDKIITEGDMIDCYELYVRPSPGLKNGRMMFYSDPKTIYHDGPNGYMTIPIEPMRPEPVMGLGFGYPVFSNLLPAQEMLDHSFSAIATNQSAFAVQTVTVPRGAGISVQEINGMNFLSFTPQANVSGGGRPEALQLSQSSPDTFKFINLLASHMVEISNLNSAIRGSPPPGVTAGTAIATLTTNALEFLSGHQRAYTQTMERVMMHVLNAKQKFAKLDRSVMMRGKNNQVTAKKYNADKLSTIVGVKIQVGNPLTQTLSGRLELAEKLSANGLIKSAQDYLLVLEGAPTRKLYETELSEDDLMQSENDALQEGKDVPTLITDDHASHIRHHSRLLNDPVVRMNGKANQIITAHIEKHVEYAHTQDPFLAAMVRTGKMPEGGPPPPPGMGPGGPGMPPGMHGAPPGAEPPAPPTDRPANRAQDLLKRPEAVGA